ncbi:MAG TPA: TonB family protein [Candidatus Acidoferrales bacterium]
MTPTKETLEAASSIKDTTAAKANANVGHLRADAVSLDVPIKVHGTRVTEAARGAVPQTEAFEETSSTMIVFPQGAVVKMATAVVGGQMVVVTNLKSGHDAICRIVKVRPYAQTHSYVEIEFTHRQPGYWGVHFPSDGPGDAPSIGPSAAMGSSHAATTVSVEMKIEKGPEADSDERFWELGGNSLPKISATSGVSNVTGAPLPLGISPSPLSAAPPAVRQSKPESPFAPIGSQEDVQAAASATNMVGGDAFTRNERAVQVAETHTRRGPAAISESLVMAESGHALSQPAHVAPFGRFAAAANLKSPPAENVMEGVTTYLEARKNPPNWLAMVLGIAALVLTATGGAFFLHIGPFASPVSVPVATVAASSPSTVHAYAPASPVAAATIASPSAAVVGADVPARPIEAPRSRVSKTPAQEIPPPAVPVQETAAPAASAHSKQAVKVPDMFGALNAHPVSPGRGLSGASTDPAPSIDATGGNSDSSALKGMVSSIAPPSPLSEMSTPAHAGGQMKPPQLISSVMPVYPQIAQLAGVEGDVVVQASIDSSGNVSATKVLAGPMMLRLAATDALRRWKYEPGTLDGKPVGTQMTVRIRFHR